MKDGPPKTKAVEAEELPLVDVDLAEDNDDDDFDELNYSQTHLDDFLKSHTSSSLMKGSNIQSGQLLNSFLSTYNKLKGTGASSLQGTLLEGTNNLGTRKGSQ